MAFLTNYHELQGYNTVYVRILATLQSQTCYLFRRIKTWFSDEDHVFGAPNSMSEGTMSRGVFEVDLKYNKYYSIHEVAHCAYLMWLQQYVLQATPHDVMSEKSGYFRHAVNNRKDRAAAEPLRIISKDFYHGRRCQELKVSDHF